MNMHVIARVWRTEVSNTVRVIRPLSTAARKAAIAPMAELSTSDVQPFTKGTIITAKITTGSRPARSKRSFSGQPTSRSSAERAGPRSGFRRQRMAI